MKLRRPDLPPQKRGRRSDPPWIGGPVAFRWDPTAVLQAERRRLYRLPRGKFLQLPSTDSGPVSQVVRRRNIRLLAIRRGRMQDVSWMAIVIPPISSWTPSVTKGKLLRYAFQKRARLSSPPWAGGPVVSAWQPSFISERRIRTYLRRTKRLDVTAQQSVAPSQYTRRRPTGFVKRGKISTPPWTQISVQVPTWTPNIISRKARTVFMKRGRRANPPWVGGPVAFVWPVPQVPRRLRTMSILVRRGRRTDVVQQQVVPVVLVWTPQPTGKRARLILTRRSGKRVDHIAGQHIPRPQTVARRTRVPVTRRARVWNLISMQAAPIQIVSGVRRRIARIRRGRRFDPTIVIPPPLSVWRPAIVRSRWAKGFNRRRKHFGSLLIIGAGRVFPTIVTGETDRTEGGETDRAQSGETESSSRGDVL